MTQMGGTETYAETKASHMMSTRAYDKPPLILDRVERVRRYGIECTGQFGDGVCFRGGEWIPGGEYIQKLTVKNVSTRMRKVKYKLPDTAVFSMVFPEKIILPPGMHTEIDVVFRPIEMQVYDDSIYFKICDSEEGDGFHVPCRALMSTLQASVPEGLDFGLCPTNETMKFDFELKNIGEVDAPFKWACPAPFRIHPVSGIIPVSSSVTIEASICPKDASVYVSLATCEVGKGIVATKPKPLLEVKLSAVGRFTHIIPSQERVDFGSLIVGQKDGALNVIEVLNRSTVPATVKCLRIENDREPVFFMDPTEFVVPPLASIPLNVRFRPTCAGSYTMESYEFVTPGGNRTLVTCSGVAESPKVTCYKSGENQLGEPNSINFRDIEIGKKTTQSIFFSNDSVLPVNYMVVCEKKGVFSFNQTVGTIPGQLEVALCIEFCPNQPINYYQRIFVLIENAMPLFIDVMGSGYISPKGEIKEQRPYPLRHAHLQASRNRAAAGLGGFTPAMLDEVLEVEGPGPLFAIKGIHGTELLVTSNVDRPTTRSGDSTRPEAAVAREFFLDMNAGSKQSGENQGVMPKDEPLPPPVFLSSDEVNFGFVSTTGLGDRRTITLTNNSHGKVAVQWILQGGASQDGGESSGGQLALTSGPSTSSNAYPFDVVPSYADISPGRSFGFKLTFNPKVSNTYFNQEIECYVYFKTQRSFRLVKDPTLQPPWCCKVRAQGYSLQGEQFAGQLYLSAPGGILEFPACHVKDSTYRTLRLDNRSNLPAMFNFDMATLDGSPFNVKPKSGLIAPRGFALVLVSFRPQEVSKYSQKLECMVNNDPSAILDVLLKAESSYPCVTVKEVDVLKKALGLDKQEASPTPPLHIKSTCAGLVSSRTVTLHNPARIPVVFSVEIPAKLSGVFAVTPRVGLLRGNQTTKLTVSFAPWEHKEYRLRVTIKTRAVGGEPMSSLASDCRLVGEAQPASFEEGSGGCHFIVVAEGSGAVVTFEPPNLDFGCLLVNDLTERPITLVNESDCDVQYELFHRIAPEKKEIVKIRAGSSLSPSTVIDDEGGDDDEGVPCNDQLYVVPKTVKSPKFPALLSVDRPAGILPAHSRTLLKATFQPRRSGDFDIGLCALVSGKDQDGKKVAIDAEDSAKVRVGDRIKLIEFLRGIPQDDPDFDDEAPLPLSASLTGSASFPTVTITDVRCLGGGLGASTRQLWSTLGLEELNHSLSQPLTKQEVKINRGGINDKSKLPGFPVKFIPCPLGSPPSVYVFRLTNPGTLTTSFAIHFPNERDIEVPSWADEGEPNEEQLRENRIIDELKSFECYPRSGTLASGESIAITLSYKYDFLDYDGLHSLSLHCVISQGKQFRLLLQGETLKPKVCRLWVSVPPSDQTFRLMPVALGTTRALAPLQTSELMNLGDSDLEYSIDIKPLSANSHRPDFFQNLYLENPKGVVAARSTHFLKWRFLPLEARQYTYELPIRYHTEEGRGDVSGLENTGSRRNSALIGRGVSPQSPTRKKLRQKSVLKIAGLGYDPREDDPHAEPPPHQNLGLVPPPYQLLSHQGVGILAQLSRERLALGRLPQRAKLRELLVLRNPSQLAAVEFAWEQTHPLISSGLLNISPSKGKILPGEFVSIKLSVDASCTPRVVETQITVRCKPAPLDEPKHRKSRGGGATSRSVTSLSRGGMMPSARSNNTRGGGGSVTSGGVDPMNNPSSSSLAPIVARSTKSRDAMLNDSSSQIMKLTGKQPKLPSRPPPPPRTGDNDEKSSTTGNNAINNTNSMNHNKMTQSQLQANNDDSQLLHLSIWFEVVDEEAYISLFQGDVSKIYVPRPRAFIPDDPAPEEYVFGKDGELSVITPQSNVGGVMSRLTNSPGYRKRGEEDKPNKKKVVPHTHHHRSHSEVATSVIESFFGDVFSDLLGRSEIQQSLMALPKQTKIPYFHDLREHANLMLRLAKAFRAFDLDGSGKLGIKEIKNAIVTMGLKAKTSEAKAFMRGLDHDNDGEVDLKEFLAASMPPGVSLALDDAIDAIEHAAKEAKAEERRLARMWMAGQSGQGSAMRADIAALTIQANFRARKARKAAELRRELATNPDLQEQHEAASRLQGQLRGMKARIAAKERHARRLTVMRQVVLGDPDFQGLLTELVEDSISNLMNEVLHKEFDLGVPPKQYAFAASSSLAEEDD